MVDRETLLTNAEHVPQRPVAVEAFWDGDTTGWGVVLTMVYLDPETGAHRDHEVGYLRGPGGDIRLFDAQVPPWPEAVLAKKVGEELSQRFSIPFFFASPEHPEDGCPRWWQRDEATPCSRCGVLLLQGDPCPWRGMCYYCHLEAEKVKG